MKKSTEPRIAKENLAALPDEGNLRKMPMKSCKRKQSSPPKVPSADAQKHKTVEHEAQILSSDERTPIKTSERGGMTTLFVSLVEDDEPDVQKCGEIEPEAKAPPPDSTASAKIPEDDEMITLTMSIVNEDDVLQHSVSEPEVHAFPFGESILSDKIKQSEMQPPKQLHASILISANDDEMTTPYMTNSTYHKNTSAALKIICMENVVEESIKWLWKPYIPFGKLTVLQGDPGDGKTTLILAIASAVTNGLPLPYG